MTYTDFFKLSFKKFMRASNVSTRIGLKILSIIGYLFFGLYMLGLVYLLYITIKKDHPTADLFEKFNAYIYIYFFIVFYVMMYLNFDSMQVKALMLLPVRKSKIIKFQLLKILFYPVNLIFIAMIGLATGLLYHNGYELTGLIFWALTILSLSFVIELILFFSSRNTWLNIVMSFSVFIIIYKIKWITAHLSFIGDALAAVYHQHLLVLIPFALLILTLTSLYFYFKKRFYLDDAIKSKQKNTVRNINLTWTKRFGLTGQLMQNDIRMIWRNARPRQALIGFVIFYVMAFFLMSDFGSKHQPEFNRLFFLMMLSGYFVMQFGNFIPAWDSEYYPLLMTQNLTYRQYIEAKWQLLSVSVVLIMILTLPFIYLGWQVYALILAMGVFTIGFNLPMVLYAGIFRTTPIKLNEKVKAFQSKDSFKMKTFFIAMLRLFLPIIIFMIIKKYLGYEYGIGFFLILGLIGIIFKKQLMNFIVKQYQNRKYRMLAAFREGEN